MPFTSITNRSLTLGLGDSLSWSHLATWLGLRSPVRRVEPDGPYRCRVFWGDEDGEETKVGPLGRESKRDEKEE